MANKRKYLSLQEFIDLKDSDLVVILTKKYGRFRTACVGPIRDLNYNESTNTLSWSDDDGDPDLSGLGLTPDTIIKDIGDSKYTTSVYVEVNRKGEMIKHKKTSQEKQMEDLSTAFGQIISEMFPPTKDEEV